MKFHFEDEQEDINLLDDDELDMVEDVEQVNEAEVRDSIEYTVPGFKLPIDIDWLVNNTKNLYTATNDLKIDKKFKIYAKISLNSDWLEINFICKQYRDFMYTNPQPNLLIKQLIAAPNFEKAIKAWDKNSKANGELIKYFTNPNNYKVYNFSEEIVSAKLRVKKEETKVIKDAHIKIDKKNFNSSDTDKYIKPAIIKTHPGFDDDDVEKATKFVVDNIKSGKISKMIIKPDLSYFYIYMQNGIYDAHDMTVIMRQTK